MKIALFGGSFDPIHVGHVRPVQQARRELGLDRVMYLPTAKPPHKQDCELVPAWARYAMVELALLHEDGLFASPFEMQSERPSYTVDTLEHFHQAWPNAELMLLLGGDSLAALTTWRAWRRIVELSEIAVLARPGWGLEELPAELREALHGRLHEVLNLPIACSSTEVRRRLATGEDLSADMLAPSVLSYLRKYDLYREPRPRDAPHSPQKGSPSQT